MEFVKIVRPTLGEPALGVGPHLFIGIELGSVGGKRFQMEAREPPAHLAHALALVDAGVVPEQNHVAAKVVQQVFEKRAHLVVPDVVGVALEVEADVPALGRDRDSGDDRDSISSIAMAHDGGLASRRPGLAQHRDQEEPRLVDEDDVGAQPCGFFFTRGHSRSRQRAIASSSRSSARRSGFW